MSGEAGLERELEIRREYVEEIRAIEAERARDAAEIASLLTALKDAERERERVRRDVLLACEDAMNTIPCCEGDATETLVEEIREALDPPSATDDSRNPRRSLENDATRAKEMHERYPFTRTTSSARLAREALKDAERERERLVGALETISRAGSVRTGVNGYEEFATGDARMEALADIAREALQGPAPQGAEAGE